MRRIFHLSLSCLAIAAMGCEPEQVIETQAIPTAGVRFINAVADTGAMDMRFVDIVESNAHFVIPFRNNPVVSGGVTASTQIQFKAARAGQRHFRIFMNGSTAAVASTVIKDTTVTLEAGKLYTALLWGNARTGSTPALQLRFFEENVPDPGANVALRVINATPVASTVRFYTAGTDTTESVVAGATKATFTNVPGMSISSYITTPPATLNYNVVNTATGCPVVFNAGVLTGTAKTVDIEALPGTTVAGSAVSIIIFPGSRVGSTAPQTAPFVFNTGSTSFYTTGTNTIARQTGAFSADGFLRCTAVTVSGFGTASNNGAAVVTSVNEPRTGTATLSATATGYARATGSFLTQGFVVGQEITAAGFTTAANNGRSTILAVTATTIDVTKTVPTVVEAAATGRSLTADPMLTLDRVLVAEANASGRRIIGPATGRPAVSSMWDRRPPR